MSRPKIAFVLRSIGLEYDDRIRKECITLSKTADVKIFVIFTNNIKEEGVTSYGIPYKSFRINTRKIFPSGKFLFLKSIEFYLKTIKHLKQYDIVWAHEVYSFLFPLLMKRNKVIWDLHELPGRFNRPIWIKIFHYIENKCKRIIHANEFRIQYLKNARLIKQPKKHVFVRNYPDKNFIFSKKTPESYKKIKDWLSGETYVYLQGLTNPGRYPYNSIASVLKSTEYKIIVAGDYYNENIKQLLINKFGEEFFKRVFFAGMINQLEIPSILKNAKFTIVLYNISLPNNRYCEANRFYQAINLGVPVITGCNEPMVEIVNKHKLGIAMDSDGSKLDDLCKSIKELIQNYDYYKRNVESNGQKFIWSDDSINKSWYSY